MYPICNLASGKVTPYRGHERDLHRPERGAAIKNYIIRICRHQHDNPGLLVGVVEDPETEERKTFGTFDELWEILNCRRKWICRSTGGELRRNIESENAVQRSKKR